ncbi:MAG: hypothetical protein ACI8WT_004855 [Clostridium sp.]|jgi:hypothetical protein
MDDKVMSNYVIDNKLVNLIPVINPKLKGKSGIEITLLYRILPCVEIDSSKIVREAYRLFYQGNIPDSSDTIFNALIPLKDFCVDKLIILAKKDRRYNPFNNRGTLRQDLHGLIYLYLDDIFNGNDKLRMLFEEYCELMYSFSNFMPVPTYFNGSQGKDGKGTWALNKDYPYLYLQNLKEENSSIFNREDNLKWLNDNMKKYRIQKIYSLKLPYNVLKEYYDDEKKKALTDFIMNAIKLIKNRFED